jgi:hypothetical protein
MRELQRSVAVAASVSAAVLVNPYFLKGALLPFELWRDSSAGVIARHIAELQAVASVPPWDWRADVWAAAVLAVAAATSFLGVGRVPVMRVLVCTAAVYLTAGAQRNLGLGAVMLTWVVLANLAERGPARMRGANWIVCSALGLACWAGAWMVASDRYWTGRQFGMGVVEGSVARGAADFVLGHGVKGNIYNGMGDGGYLIWRGLTPVYVDGRTEVRSHEFWREYFEGGGDDWPTLVSRWGINAVLVPRRGYEWLSRVLARDEGWALVYADERNVVFVRDIPEHAGLFRLDPAREGLSGTGG